MARGKKTGGKIKGSKNKATIEREAAARIERERVAELERIAATGATDLDKAKVSGKKLMKQIAFDLAELFMGLAVYYQPVPAPDGTLTGNPRYVGNEDKFKEFAIMAKDTAIAAASYESPKLSAVMVGAAIINEIEITGGLPDDQDGGLSSEDVIEGKANVAEDAARNAPRLAGPDADAGAGGAADAAPEAGRVVPHEGEAEGGPLRKAVG